MGGGASSFVAGFTFNSVTHPYNGFPTAEEYFEKFKPSKFNIWELITKGYDETAEVDPAMMKAVSEMISTDKFYDRMPISTGGNVFLNGAKPCDKESNFVEVPSPQVELKLEEKDGSYTLVTDLYKHLPSFETPFISTELLGEAFQPEQLFENPDGSPIFFNKDFFGNHRGVNPLPGPFENGSSEIRLF